MDGLDVPRGGLMSRGFAFVQFGEDLRRLRWFLAGWLALLGSRAALEIAAGRLPDIREKIRG